MKLSVKYLKIVCNLFMALFILFLVIYVAPRVIVYFMPFVVGFILSLIANPIVKFLEKRIKIKRKYGSFIIIVAVIALLVLLCYGAGAALIYGLKDFAAYLPTMSENAKDEIANAIYQVETIINSIPFVNDVDLSKISETLMEYMGDFVTGGDGNEAVTSIGDVAKSIPNIIVNVIIGLLATYFFITDRDKLGDIIMHHIPNDFKEQMSTLCRQSLGVVGAYFKAQLKIMVVIYVIVTIGLMILKIDYAWLIGFGIAFLDMLPVFGTGTVLCPWAAVKLFSGHFQIAIGMLILYAVTLAVHQLVQPKLVGESVGLNPFAALFFMYIGYKVGGMTGMIVAIPVGMILINLYKAGAFDNLIWCMKEVVNDFNKLRKINREK